jgi:hypothetical protein
MNRSGVVVAASVVVSVITVTSVLAQGAQLAKPGPEHQRLGYFVGKWTSEGDIKPGPMGPGGKISSTDTCDWFEGRFAIVCHSDGRTPMGATKSIGILAYSSEERVYTYYGIENSSMAMASIPRGTVKGDTWTYTDESVMGGKKIKSRVTIKELSPSAYTFTMELQGPDGKWAPAIQTRNTKTK